MPSHVVSSFLHWLLEWKYCQPSASSRKGSTYPLLWIFLPGVVRYLLPAHTSVLSQILPVSSCTSLELSFLWCLLMSRILHTFHLLCSFGPWKSVSSPHHECRVLWVPFPWGSCQKPPPKQVLSVGLLLPSPQESHCSATCHHVWKPAFHYVSVCLAFWGRRISMNPVTLSHSIVLNCLPAYLCLLHELLRGFICTVGKIFWLLLDRSLIIST